MGDVPVSDFLFYVKNTTILTKRIEYGTSEQLDRVKERDTLWIVTFHNKRLYLRGRIKVDRIVPRDEAEQLLGRRDVFSSKYYALPRPGQAEGRRNVDITNMAVELRFEGGVDQLPMGFSAQHLRTMRQLSPPSAGC